MKMSRHNFVQIEQAVSFVEIMRILKMEGLCIRSYTDQKDKLRVSVIAESATIKNQFCVYHSNRSPSEGYPLKDNDVLKPGTWISVSVV